MNHLFRLAPLLGLAVAGGAHAFTLGDIRYYPFVNGLSPFVADLGGVSGTYIDVPISSNAYNGALYLRDGIPVDYFVPLQRLFVGDNDHATADAVFDRYLFKLDPATVRGDRARGHFRLLVQNGMDPDRGLTSFLDLTSFALFATNSAGAPVGPAIRSGNEFDAPLDVGERYVLQLLGNLGGAINADKFGRYVIQFTPTAPVPLPPAGLLLLSVLLPMAVRFRLRDARGGKPA